MAHAILPHYDHHMREAHRTRRRFRLSLALLFVVLFIALGLQYRVSNAATYTTVSGRVFNGTTGLGMANIRLYVCWTGGSSFYVVTNSTGVWTASLPSQAHVCVRYSSGAPATVTGPVAVNNQGEHPGAASYEYQVVGYDCYHNIISGVCWGENRTWDRDDTGYDFEFMSGVAPAVTRPVPRMTPGVTPTPVPATKSSVPTFGAAAASADGPSKTPPTVPGSLQATVAEGSAVVTLTWQPSTSDNGIKGYVLERSLDQLNWEKVQDSLQGTSYSDTAAGFGIHYYYRLSAVDPAGNVSGYAMADVTTADFTANTDTVEGTVYTSEDSVATVTVPPGAVAQGADCSVATTVITDGSHKPGISTQALVAGPYTLVCKTVGGAQIVVFDQPLSWSFNLKNKLRNVDAPQPYTYDDSGPGTLIKGYQYDARNQVIRVNSTSTSPLMVLADIQQGVNINFVAGIFLALVMLVLVAVLILRKNQKHTYEDYLRKKYYNL